MQLEIRYRTEYSYEPAIAGAVTLLRMRPRSRPGLRVLESTITAAPGVVTRGYVDAWGTQVDIAEFDLPHAKSQFEVFARVETLPSELPGESFAPGERAEPVDSGERAEPVVPGERAEPVDPGERAEPVDSVDSQHLCRLPDPLAPWERHHYTSASARVRLEDVIPLGWNVGDEGRAWSSVESFLAWLPARFRYEVGATDADTTVAQFITEGAGVCQDFAHLMIAMLRQWGWPARYVSGYLFSAEPAGNSRIEAEAMHAWVEAYRPDRGWIALDATSGQYADDRYVPVGRGRDYADVAPVRGVITGASTQISVARLEMTGYRTEQ